MDVSPCRFDGDGDGDSDDTYMCFRLEWSRGA
jgi:hypothetical protein